ncbi:hypothetical protein BSR29_06235 [Boudabousia liubingyangii]|uniref:HIT domain-containing protein n=1 Tax=Boudabousia liubingyangii TaxID=1921764 RepID=A0A1Q5PKQ2_9ACTO|nr:HIT family protein [Boudabousia liubingyangii]OKL46462.1 hypothetical protein BSR28_08045 [Boudabousia liubingyangii]OKL47215.1 hypothetical protein BSR29_06235 [Boudabousia liubingyangii]
MSTIFEQIIAGEIPSQKVYEDDVCVAFLDIAPQSHGHFLLVPRVPVDQFDELPADTLAHLFELVGKFSKPLREEFGSERCGVVIAGYGVPHAHIHLFPTNGMEDFNLEKHLEVSPEELAADAERVRKALSSVG